MDFTITEEQQDITNLASQILGDQVTPDHLHQYDSREVTRFDQKLMAQLAEGGLLGISIDSEFGGMGFGFGEFALFVEECGRVLAPVPVIPSCVSAMVIEKFGDNQAKAILHEVVAGTAVISAAIQEPCNEDNYAPTCKVEGGELTGVKQGVPYFEQASKLLVVASEGGETGLYVIDPRDSGVQSTALWATTMEPQSYLSFDKTPATKLGGEDAVKFFLERYTAALCAFQVGALEKMVKLTAEYTSEREQFGVKIATFQAVGHRTANCYIDAKCLKLVTQQAVSLLNDEAEASVAIDVAKAWCGDASHRVSTTTQHLHGGMGVDRDYPLWRYALWAKQNELQLGSTTLHLERLGDAIAAGDFDIDA